MSNIVYQISEGEVNLDNIGYSIRGNDGEISHIVKDCTFVAKKNTFTVVVGPSGCGKTTLMNLIAGYIQPSSGEVKLNGIEVVGPSRDRLMVFQETALFPWMTALENVSYGPMVQGVKSRSAIKHEASGLLDRFGLSEFKNRYPRDLSGGMQRRAELARAMINDPSVLLMDEPFRGLDAMTRQIMQEYLTGVFEDTRTTTIFVTSEIDEAIFLADELVILSGSPASVATVLSVDLPRPRTFDVSSGAKFGKLKEKAMELLYTQAAASFSSNGRVSDLKEAFEKRHANS